MRRIASVVHFWLGIAGGAFVCLICLTGAVVTLRPPLAEWMAPATKSPLGCGRPIDWARAEARIFDAAHEPINRLYTFSGTDPRLHVRLMTATPAIFDHIIYDGCADQVLGTIHLQDWLVDLHHNLWAGHTGRQVTGAFGLALLLSAATGLIVWLCGRPDLRTAFLIRLRSPQRAWRDWHRAVGLAAMLVLGLEAYTGLWLCFPDAMRATLIAFVPVPKDARPPRPGPADIRTPKASLAVVMASAIAAVPDGRVREIRLPEDYGNVQIRMWRPGDFRSLGNNVVTVSNVTGRVITVDLYARKTTPQGPAGPCRCLKRKWRRGGDSNPRAPCGTRRFRGAPVTTTSVPLQVGGRTSILP